MIAATPKYTDHMPVWAYFDEELLELEKQALFRTQWLLVGHVNDMPEPGDYLTLDAVGERALVIRDHDGRVRGFHNVCRHRGARLRDAPRGHCAAVLTCPFHGWTYQLNGQLVGVPAEQTFTADTCGQRTGLDKSGYGLVPLELEIWLGFIFVRFQGDGPAVAQLMQSVTPMFSHYRIEAMQPLLKTKYEESRPYNWKLIHDIDNEGYHVPVGHPALRQLYGDHYYDSQCGDVPISVARFNDTPGTRWSVRHYRRLLPEFDHLPAAYQNCWQYGFLFPSMVFGLYPERVEFYMTVPLATGRTLYRGASYGLPDGRRRTRAARYLGQRINAETEREDEDFVRRLQDTMGSSVFPQPTLSSLEHGVQQFHHAIQAILPVTRLKHHPGKGLVAATNQAMRVSDCRY